VIYAAAVLSGLGGLLIELVLVRRYGLLLGNTSESSALVIGTYLMGLGVGGLLVPWAQRWGMAQLRAAAVLYVAVAASALALDLGLRRIDPVSFPVGLALLSVAPGIPTLLMGMAFPLVLGALGRDASRWRVGLLMAANLAGSLAATALGSNLWIPEFGMAATALGASGAYAGAALLLGVAGGGAAVREQERPVAPPAPLSGILPLFRPLK